MDFRYDAFFSYRHKPLDADITQRTFNLVESYRLPKTLRDRGFEEVQRAFRDTEELPVSRVLTATIDQALHSTKCLIVVCSTDTPSSEWIDREVATFIELDRADHIYPLLITGDPEHSFPPSLPMLTSNLGRWLRLLSTASRTLLTSSSPKHIPRGSPRPSTPIMTTPRLRLLSIPVMALTASSSCSMPSTNSVSGPSLPRLMLLESASG